VSGVTRLLASGALTAPRRIPRFRGGRLRRALFTTEGRLAAFVAGLVAACAMVGLLWPS
jgi:hypothetical protein